MCVWVSEWVRVGVCLWKRGRKREKWPTSRDPVYGGLNGRLPRLLVAERAIDRAERARERGGGEREREGRGSQAGKKSLYTQLQTICTTYAAEAAGAAQHPVSLKRCCKVRTHALALSQTHAHPYALSLSLTHPSVIFSQVNTSCSPILSLSLSLSTAVHLFSLFISIGCPFVRFSLQWIRRSGPTLPLWLRLPKIALGKKTTSKKITGETFVGKETNTFVIQAEPSTISPYNQQTFQFLQQRGREKLWTKEHFTS